MKISDFFKFTLLIGFIMCYTGAKFQVPERFVGMIFFVTNSALDDTYSILFCCVQIWPCLKTLDSK